MKRTIAISIACSISASGWADSPGMIHYQGRLVLGTNLYSGPVSVVFQLYDAPSGGSLLHKSTNFATAVDGLYATVIGELGVVGDLNAALTNTKVWLETDVNGTTLSPREQLLAVPYAQAVYGMTLYPGGSLALNAEHGTNEITTSVQSTIAGGAANIISGSSYATIGGGRENRIQSNVIFASIGGGRLNLIEDFADFATIGGGQLNLAATNTSFSTIGGGNANQIQRNAQCATIGGGAGNQVQTNALFGTIPGGSENRIGPDATNSFAAGFRAWANHSGAFVWADRSTAVSMASTNDHSVTFRAAGGYRFFSDAGMTLGAHLAPNATAWAAISDRNAKEHIDPIDTDRVLDGIKQMPVSEWQYKADPTERRCIGPMAQDFHALFGLGDDKTINTLDADGVLFAAVQALARENEALRKRLDELEHRFSGAAEPAR